VDERILLCSKHSYRVVSPVECQGCINPYWARGCECVFLANSSIPARSWGTGLSSASSESEVQWFSRDSGLFFRFSVSCWVVSRSFFLVRSESKFMQSRALPRQCACASKTRSRSNGDNSYPLTAVWDSVFSYSIANGLQSLNLTGRAVPITPEFSCLVSKMFRCHEL
jgi:hypothetical protein